MTLTKHKATLTSLLGAMGAAALIAATAATATAADTGEITGEVSVTLDFTTAGQVSVLVETQNLSTVPAYGSAVVYDRDGRIYPFGPKLYAAGEDWSYSITLPGYTCADIPLASAVAMGADVDPATTDWTTGIVRSPDTRVTVIGCDAPPPPPPTTTPTPGVVTVTPTPVPAAVTPLPAAAPGSDPESEAEAEAAGELAATGPNTGTLLVTGAIAVAAMTVGSLLVARRRRSS